MSRSIENPIFIGPDVRLLDDRLRKSGVIPGDAGLRTRPDGPEWPITMNVAADGVVRRFDGQMRPESRSDSSSARLYAEVLK